VIGPHARVLASIDTRTHRLTATASPSTPRRRREDASTSWLPLAVPTALLLLVAAAGARRAPLGRRLRSIAARLH
jgi:hypothetical protein